MKLKGRLVDITQDILAGGFQIRLAVDTVPSGVERLREETALAITLAKWREQRSLTANAYYWVIVGKIADMLKISQSVVHNILLRRYGAPEIIDGETLTIMVADTEEAEENVLNSELYHLKPTSFTKEGKDGRMFRAYRVLKGSSAYDSKEMATLIDGAVSEAKEMGIETLPDWEIEKMKEAYREKYRTD